MSWSQSPQHDVQSSSGSGNSESSAIAANSNLQSLYYLLVNNGKLNDLVNQQQLLQTDGISTLTQQLSQQPQEEQTQSPLEQHKWNQLSELERNDKMQEQQQHQQQEQQQQQKLLQQQQQQEIEEEILFGGGSAKELRYRRTMSALEKAGLLDLTLKVSELIKQNETLQKDIDTLEHIVETTYMVVMENQP